MTYCDPRDRFVQAQTLTYESALAEICRGAKRSHWMWYIFLQIVGLGRTAPAQHFAIRSIEEARAYLDHPILGPRYLECITALQDLGISDSVTVFGSIDAIKLRSSLTLFEVAKELPIVSAALARWFAGDRDQATLVILASRRDNLAR